MLRFLWILFIAYLIIRIGKRLFGSSARQKRDFNYTNETSRQEGDVVIEKTAPKKSAKKVTEDGDFVDYEELE